MNKDNVKSTMATAGWIEIENFLRVRIAEARLAKNIDSNKRYEDIAIDCLAKSKAAKIIESALKTLNGIKSENKKKEEVWD